MDKGSRLGMAWLGGTWEGGCSDDYVMFGYLLRMMFGASMMAGYI